MFFLPHNTLLILAGPFILSSHSLGSLFIPTQCHFHGDHCSIVYLLWLFHDGEIRMRVLPVLLSICEENPSGSVSLTHWGQDKTVDISQTTFSDVIFLNEDARISIDISLKFVPKGQINEIPALVQIMAWRRPGDESLSEPMMRSLLTNICISRPQ